MMTVRLVIYRKVHILKVEDIFKLHTCKYGWKFIHKKLPRAIDELMETGNERTLHIMHNRFNSLTLKHLSGVQNFGSMGAELLRCNFEIWCFGMHFFCCGEINSLEHLILTPWMHLINEKSWQDASGLSELDCTDASGT